jgi:hypothetical protein
MTWREISFLIDAQLNVQQQGVPNLHELAYRKELLAETLLTFECSEAEVVDAAVLQFCATRKWPSLSAIAQAMLVLRLEFAAGLCALFDSQPDSDQRVVPEPSLDIPEEHVLAWLLINAWHTEGFPRLHDTAERILRGGKPSSDVS